MGEYITTTYIIDGGHTIGALLTKQIKKDTSVIFCGYTLSQPHTTIIDITITAPQPELIYRNAIITLDIELLRIKKEIEDAFLHAQRR